MDQPPSEIIPRVTTEVALAAGTPITELPPVTEAINPDGLESLVTDEKSHDVRITFTYAGHRVNVHADNTVYVRGIHDPTSDPGDEPSVADQ